MARELVGLYSVSGVSMSAIADRAGVGKPTIYLRWPNVKAVVLAALASLPKSQTPDHRRALRDRLETALRDDLQLMVTGAEAPFFRAVMFHTAVDTSFKSCLSHAVLNPRTARLASIAGDGIMEGTLASGVNPQRLADVLMLALSPNLS
ncbi:MAG: TetR/AcrR family transcriptional regulator [Thermoleophilia bacterium]